MVGGSDSEEVSGIKIKRQMVQSFREQVGFQTSAEHHQGICFPDCGRAFQSFGAELGFFPAQLGIV